MTDKIRELVKNTVNAEIINALCDVIDAQDKRIRELEESSQPIKVIKNKPITS